DNFFFLTRISYNKIFKSLEALSKISLLPSSFSTSYNSNVYIMISNSSNSILTSWPQSSLDNSVFSIAPILVLNINWGLIK
ncbi:hypothetical protein NCER_102638, partial [Vairimorpha ceranae BRL01]